jgi:hypothetical protein
MTTKDAGENVTTVDAPITRRSRRPPAPQPRDQDATPFTPILEDLIVRIPGAYAAALVDTEGETVDYSGSATPFDVKVSAAHWRIVLNDIAAASQLGAPQSVVVRGTKRSFIAYTLPDAYALVILLRRLAGFTASTRAFFACERALCHEAGWTPSARVAHWFPIEVHYDKRRRPVAIAESETAEKLVSVEVLGSVMGLNARERGFRVRLSSGIELTLVREPGGCWYSDDPLHALKPRSSQKPDTTKDAAEETHALEKKR